jgi:hypothetical protein
MLLTPKGKVVLPLPVSVSVPALTMVRRNVVEKPSPMMQPISR